MARAIAAVDEDAMRQAVSRLAARRRIGRANADVCGATAELGLLATHLVTRCTESLRLPLA